MNTNQVNAGSGYDSTAVAEGSPTLESLLKGIGESRARLSNTFGNTQMQLERLGFSERAPGATVGIGKGEAAPTPTMLEVLQQEAATLNYIANNFEWALERLKAQYKG